MQKMIRGGPSRGTSAARAVRQFEVFSEYDQSNPSCRVLAAKADR